MITRVFTADCMTCPATFTDTLMISAEKRWGAKIAAVARNRDIWSQTHCDTTGHARFRVGECKSTFTILGRVESEQIRLDEDPAYGVIRLGVPPGSEVGS